MDSTRDRSKAIYHDFLALIDVEIGIYGRNREHLIHLPDEERSTVRKFMNDVAIKRAEIGNKLKQFYQSSRFADQVQVEGRGPEAQRLREAAQAPLQEAQTAADRIVMISNGAAPLIDKLAALEYQ